MRRMTKSEARKNTAHSKKKGEQQNTNTVKRSIYLNAQTKRSIYLNAKTKKNTNKQKRIFNFARNRANYKVYPITDHESCPITDTMSCVRNGRLVILLMWWYGLGCGVDGPGFYIRAPSDHKKDQILANWLRVTDNRYKSEQTNYWLLITDYKGIIYNEYHHGGPSAWICHQLQFMLFHMLSHNHHVTVMYYLHVTIAAQCTSAPLQPTFQDQKMTYLGKVIGP